MPDWLSDPSPVTYVVLAAAAAGAVVYWYRTQTRSDTLSACGVLAAVALLVLIDFLVESPREEAVRRVEEMIAAANEFKPDRVMPNVSEKFRYHDQTKASFGNAQVWHLARHHKVRLAVWDFDRGYVERPSENTIAIGFMLKVDADGGQAALYVRAQFVRDSDGAWRLQTFTVFNDPLQKSHSTEFVLPGF